MKVYFSAAAKRSLDKLYDWYKDQGLSKVGNKKRAGIIKKSKLLKKTPFMGQVEIELEHLNLGH